MWRPDDDTITPVRARYFASPLLSPCLLEVRWNPHSLRTRLHPWEELYWHPLYHSLQLFAHVLSAILKCVTWTNTYFEVRKTIQVLFRQIEQRKTEAHTKKTENQRNVKWKDEYKLKVWYFRREEDSFRWNLGLPDVIILKTTIWKAVMSEFFETLFVWNVPRRPLCYEEVNLLFLIMANIMLA